MQPVNTVNRIISLRSDCGNFSANISSRNGWANFDVFDNRRTGAPIIKVPIYEDLITLLVLSIDKALTATESIGYYNDVTRMRSREEPNTRDYVGTVRLEVAHGDKISLGLCSNEHKEMIFFPVSTSHIEAVKPSGRAPSMWEKTRMGVRYLKKVLEVVLPEFNNATRLAKEMENQNGGGAPSGGGGTGGGGGYTNPQGGTGEDTPF